MSKLVEVERSKIGLEDLLIGEGGTTQIRAGSEVRITKINASNMPYDENLSLRQALDREKGRAFARFDINSDGDLIATYAEEGIFSINSLGELILDSTE